MDVSDHLIDRLHAWGVRRIYGYPGDGVNGLMRALDKRRDDVDFVQMPHEELTAFTAVGHAKYTGQVGVCLATSGPGAIHLLNGLYDAKLDHQPVVAIVGQQARASMGGDYQQEVDLASIFKDVASEYCQTIQVPAQVRHVVDRALRIAIDQRCVTCIIVPNDVQDLKAVETPPREHGTVHSGIGTTAKRIVPPLDALREAAAILNAGERVAILAGAGAIGATDELIEVADVLGAGIAKALLGKSAVPDDLPFVTGAIGLLGTQPSTRMMEGCDTLLMVGSHFPYAEYLPKEGEARGVQIDIDGRRLGTRYPMELNLVGDSALTLRALLPLLERKSDRAWRDDIEENVARYARVLEEHAASDQVPLNPQRVFHALSPLLPDDTIVAGDSGSTAAWYARHIQLRRGMMASLSGGLASMGSAVPYAIAAKYAHPTRPVVAFVGDGAMQMIGINGLITISRVWRTWADPRLVVMVLNNGDLNFVSWEQRANANAPKFDRSQDLPEFRYAEFASLLGLTGIRVERPEEIDGAWKKALSNGRPTLVEMVTDPTVPPLPPHIPVKQMKSYLSALLHGDPEAGRVIRETAREWWASMTR